MNVTCVKHFLFLNILALAVMGCDDSKDNINTDGVNNEQSIQSAALAEVPANTLAGTSPNDAINSDSTTHSAETAPPDVINDDMDDVIRALNGEDLSRNDPSSKDSENTPETASATSAQDNPKIKVVRAMYTELPENEDLSQISDKYWSGDLQNAHQTAKRYASTPEQMYDEGISSCDEAGWDLTLLPTRDLAMDEVIDIQYRVLNNGNVRASLITIPYGKDIDSHDFDIFKDYALNCDAGSCKVTDIIGYDGISAKSEIIKYCQ